MGVFVNAGFYVGALLFGIWTVTGIVGGFFPCDPAARARLCRGAIHVILGVVGTVCLLPVPALIWLGVRGDPRLEAYWWFTLAVQGLSLACFLLLGAVYFGISPLERLLEANRIDSAMFSWRVLRLDRSHRAEDLTNKHRKGQR